MLKSGNNRFHLSLLDMGKFNLKGFMAAEQKNIIKGIKDLVADFIDKFSEVKYGLKVGVNIKNRDSESKTSVQCSSKLSITSVKNRLVF
jgi:hypothetical protein